MKLRHKMGIWTGVALISSVTLMYFVSCWIFREPFRQVEAQRAVRSLNTTVTALTSEGERLMSQAKDYGWWDETYEFARNQSTEYVDANYTAESLSNLNIDMVLAVGVDGELLFARAIHPDSGKLSDASEAMVSPFLVPGGAMANRFQQATGFWGFLNTANGWLLLGSHPISLGDGSAPRVGNLVFARYFDTSVLAHLNGNALAQVTATERSAVDRLPESAELWLATSSPVPAQVFALEATDLIARTLVRDLTGTSKRWLETRSAMESFPAAMRSVRRLTLCGLILGLIASVMALSVLQRTVSSRLEELQATARNLKSDGMEETRFNEEGGDEIAALAGTLNHMVERAQKFAEDLRCSEERYALSAAATNDGLWDWDLATGTIYYSPRWAAMLGLDNRLISAGPAAWLDRVHPSDRNSLDRKLVRQMDGSLQCLSIEYRMRDASGQWRWMQCRAMAVTSPQGEVERLVGSQTDITERKTVEEQLRHDALYDRLTGLANRSLFCDWLLRCMSRVHRNPKYCFAVLLLDIDRFKVFNDSLGHFAGDELLRAFGERLTEVLREQDTVARIGGDEFAVLVDDVSDAADATRVTERILAALKAPFTINSTDFFLGASIGIALHRSTYLRPDELLRDADTALYRAKSQGRGQFAVFDGAMHDAAVRRLTLENNLRAAIQREEFVLHYQPIISMEERQVVGVEALVRWRHPVRGMVAPSEFIPVAEDTALIVPLGEWVLRKACCDLAEWRAHWPENARPMTVSVNLSTRQFHLTDVVRLVDQALEASGLPASALHLEITESALMENSEAAAQTLKDLRKRGVAIALDDFGTGYSSLSYLHLFEIDTLKIDKSFVARAGDGGRYDSIARAVLLLATNLGVPTVAEGVETEHQEQWLRNLGCSFAQGYFYSKPVPAEEITKLLDRSHGCLIS